MSKLYEQQKAQIEFDRKITLRVALHEFQKLQLEKQRAEKLDRQKFKEELRYRMIRNTTKFQIPKKKTPIAIRRAIQRQQKLDNFVFTQRQIELAQKIIEQLEGRNND